MNIFTNIIKHVNKYKSEKLGCDSDERKFVKGYLDKTTVNFNRSRKNLADFNVYKVTENNPIKLFGAKRNNLMLFHGTTDEGVKGILKEGFRNSEKGWFGKGVYMTDCSRTASYYCDFENKYIFVNEVLESDSLQTFKHGDYYSMADREFKPEHQFEKHVFEGGQQPTETEYKEDGLGRRYRDVAVCFKSEDDEYVADERVVVPRYLIVIGSPPECLNEDKVSNVEHELNKGGSSGLGCGLIINESWYVKHQQVKFFDVVDEQIRKLMNL